MVLVGSRWHCLAACPLHHEMDNKIERTGDTRPLLAYNNEPVTVENIAGTGIYEIHYNKYTNEVYLVNGGYRPTTATAATNVAAKSK